MLLGVVVFYEVSAGLIWTLWHNLTWQCSNRENSMLFTAKKIPRTSRGTFKNPWTKRLPSPNSDMPTLHNRNALNIQTTAKQVCCTLSGRTTTTTTTTVLQQQSWDQCFEYPENPYPNEGTPKNTFQIFLPKKIPEWKISNPKILRSSSLIEIGMSPKAPPPPPHRQVFRYCSPVYKHATTQPQDCSQHDWVSLLRICSGYRFNQWRNKIEPSPLPWIFKMVPSAISLIRLLDSGRRPYSKRRLDILRFLSTSCGRIGRRKQVKRAKKCWWDNVVSKTYFLKRHEEKMFAWGGDSFTN